jgi:amino acid permease
VARACGPRFAPLIDFVVAIKCFGVGVSFLIVIADSMPVAMKVSISMSQTDICVLFKCLIQLFQAVIFWQSRNVWLTITLAVILVMATFPNLHAFKWTSGISVVFLVLLVFIVALFSVPGSGYDPCEGFKDSIVSINSSVPEYGYEIRDNRNERLLTESCGGDTSLGMTSFRSISLFFYIFTCHQVLIVQLCNYVSSVMVLW